MATPDASAPNHRPKLPPEAIDRALRLLAGWEPTRTIAAKLSEEFQRPVDYQQIIRLKRNPAFADTLAKYRREAEARMSDEIPIANRVWRMKKRQKLVKAAESGPEPDFQVVRGLLTDAAKEMGHLGETEGAPKTLVGQINLQLVQNVLTLPADVVESFITTGVLPPGSYLTDAPHLSIAAELPEISVSTALPASEPQELETSKIPPGKS